MPIEIPNLTETQKTFSEITRNQITLNSAVNTLQENDKIQNEKLDKLHKTVYGNGEAGLDEQVRSNTTFRLTAYKIAWIVGGAILAQTITFGYFVVQAYYTYLPILEKLAAKP